MQETSWDDARVMLGNGSEISSTSAVASGGDVRQSAVSRSQDDARVGYFFQRPQAIVINQQYANRRWAASGDESFVEQARTVSDLEREFHRLAFENPEEEAALKMWAGEKGLVVDGGVAPDGSKCIFPLANLPNNPWLSREDSWRANQSDQSLTELMHNSTHRRPGSFPGSTDMPSIMSPHSVDTSNLGVNMAEYVLGTSPMGKESDQRRHPTHARRFVGGGDADNTQLPVDKTYGVDGSKDQEQDAVIHMNGTIQNGIEDKTFCRAPGSRQNSPTEAEQTIHSATQKLSTSSLPGSGITNDVNMASGMLAGSAGMNMHSLSLDVPQFEVMGYDPFQAMYPNHLMHPGAMDSPNFGIDYGQQMLQNRHQGQAQQLTMMPPQQQFAMAPDQSLGPPVLPQYYNVQPSWGVYPPQAVMQAQRQLQTSGQHTPSGPGTPQPQLLRGQTARPLTPQQQQQQQQQMDAMTPLHTPGGTPAGYQLLAPAAYYDQNGQIFMNNGRQLGHVVRLVSPGPPTVLMTGQQGYPTSAYTPASSGMFTPRANTTPVWLNAQQTAGMNGAGSTLNLGTMATGLLPQQPRRDSFGSQDFKQVSYTTPFNQFYGPLGGASLSPGGPIGLAHTMTPPPALPGNTTGLILPGLGLGTATGRLYSAAPGAETKYRNGSIALNTGLFGTSLFNQQVFTKSDNMAKEVTGRSQLLEDFRSNRMPNLQLRDLADHVVEFSQDQHGSRFIQQKLEHATPAEKLMVFNEILSAAYGLMTDVFGNYVIQKFLEFGTPEQKQTLAQRVRGHVLALALHMYGCRVIQKALESIPLEMQVEILKELDGHVLKCVKDQNGNHVVQKCIECIEPSRLGFITDAFKGQVLSLAMHPYGCRVIQRILEHCNAEQIASIMDELREQTEHLVFDQYGNYVIQHVLEHGRPEDKSQIINQLRGKILPLSQHKFASNVIEKCVSHSSRAERAQIIEEVCTMNDGPQSALYTMMKDQFANYVVQKMIDIADQAQRKMLLQKIRPHVATLRKYAYGKHILAKLEKFYVKNNAELGPIGVNPISAMQ